MTRLRENKRILVFLCCISILYACVLVADTASETGPAAVTFKYLGDLCCLLVVLVSWKNAYDRRDVGLLLAAFLFIMGADALFLFARQLEWGILCYCFAHLALIRRYRGKAFGRGSAAALAALAF